MNPALISFELPREPEQRNPEAEQALFEQILEDVRTRTKFRPPAVTPWVAVMLGRFALVISEEKNFASAVHVARKANEVAIATADEDVTTYVTLIAGHMELCYGIATPAIRETQFTNATRAYDVVLGSSGAITEPHRGAAELDLGYLALQRGDIASALRHYERGLFVLAVVGMETKRPQVYSGLVDLYKQRNDAAGFIHCARQLGNEAEAIVDAVARQPVSRSILLGTVARLHSFGEHDLADRLVRRSKER